MRNIIAQGYFEVDLEVPYDGVRWNIEPLGAQLGMPGAGWFAIYGSGIFQGR